MQIEKSRINLQEVLGAYPTLTHFHEHYEKQGLLKRILHDAKTVSELELRN